MHIEKIYYDENIKEYHLYLKYEGQHLWKGIAITPRDLRVPM